MFSLTPHFVPEINESNDYAPAAVCYTKCRDYSKSNNFGSVWVVQHLERKLNLEFFLKKQISI